MAHRLRQRLLPTLSILDSPKLAALVSLTPGRLFPFPEVVDRQVSHGDDNGPLHMDGAVFSVCATERRRTIGANGRVTVPMCPHSPLAGGMAFVIGQGWRAETVTFASPQRRSTGSARLRAVALGAPAPVLIHRSLQSSADYRPNFWTNVRKLAGTRGRVPTLGDLLDCWGRNPDRDRVRWLWGLPGRLFSVGASLGAIRIHDELILGKQLSFAITCISSRLLLAGGR